MLIQRSCDERVCVGSLADVIAHGQALCSHLVLELGWNDACRAASRGPHQTQKPGLAETQAKG